MSRRASKPGQLNKAKKRPSAPAATKPAPDGRSRKKPRATRATPATAGSRRSGVVIASVPRVGQRGKIVPKDVYDAAVPTILVEKLECGADGRWERLLVRPEAGGESRWILRRELARDGKKYMQAVRMVPNGSSVEIPTPEPHGLTGTVPRGDRSPSYDQRVNTLDVSEEFFGPVNPKRFVARVLIAEFRRCYATREAGEEWFVWAGERDYHPKGLCFGVGFSTNVPLGVIAVLEEVITGMGLASARGSAVPDRHGLDPLLYVGDDGIEVLSMF